MDEPRPPSSAKPGTLIRGKYRVDNLLGEGAVGVVVKATHLDLGKAVAIKILRPQWQTPELEARFEREARVAARLPADHIARVTDVGHTEAGECFLVMELLLGRDLADELVARPKLPVGEAVELILQAMAGVAEAHAAGLVHRDLKPANLFLVPRRNGRFTVKVLDFGLSKAPLQEGETELTRTTSNFGTPQYMSPEQIQSAKHVDPRSDQHALAMILFEMLTDRSPYEAPTLTSLAVAIATEPPPWVRTVRPDVPAALDEAINRGLAKRPDDRFSNLLGFARAIAPFAGNRAGDSLELIAAALEPEGATLPLSPGTEGAPGDGEGPTVAKIPAEAHGKHLMVQMPGARDDDGRATVQRLSLPVDAQSYPDGDRERGSITAAPRRPATPRSPIIVSAVVLVAVAIGSFVVLRGVAPLRPSLADTPPSAPSGEPSAALSVVPAPVDLPTTALPAVSPGPSAAPTSSTSAGTVAPSAATPNRPRQTAIPKKRNNPGQSAREVFGED